MKYATKIIINFSNIYHGDYDFTEISMNLYSESIAGKLWEAGIASIDPNNVKLALDTYQQLLSDPYTNLQN